MKLKRFSISATMLILAGALLVPTAFGQRFPTAGPAIFPRCPATVASNPLSLLQGQTWVFHWEGIADAASASGNIYFGTVPSPNSQAGVTGFINVIETRNVLGSIFRFLNYNGRYQIYPDCTGGVLMFNSGAPASKEFDFYFRERAGNAFGSLVMTSIDPINFGGSSIEQIIGNVIGGVEHGEAEFQHCDTATLGFGVNQVTVTPLAGCPVQP
jgi:hypothetical protein